MENKTLQLQGGLRGEMNNKLGCINKEVYHLKSGASDRRWNKFNSELADRVVMEVAQKNCYFNLWPTKTHLG